MVLPPLGLVALVEVRPASRTGSGVVAATISGLWTAARAAKLCRCDCGDVAGL
jgi:hypothetical protein